MSQELVKYLICQTNREPVASGMVSIHAVCERKDFRCGGQGSSCDVTLVRWFWAVQTIPVGGNNWGLPNHSGLEPQFTEAKLGAPLVCNIT